MSATIRCLLPFVIVLAATSAQRPAPSGSDWPDWRGPNRDGISAEKNLPASWSPAGDNLAWKAPYGSRSTPIVLGNRVFLQNTSGKGELEQERVMCFDADTGKVLWEYKFNVYLSDVPTHRVGWASPVADPETGNIYAYGVGGTLLGLSYDGKLLWERSLGEDFGLITTHGGRTVAPVIEGDLVIVSGLVSSWGANARGAHRFMAFDKKNGATIWINSPGGRPFDTTYSAPIAAVINGTRLLIAGGGDGAVHAMKPQTGEPVWSYTISKRGVNTGAVLNGNNVIVSHSEENLDSSEMGLLAEVDGTGKGQLGPQQVKWAVRGFQGGYSSPIVDGDRILQLDNGANLFAFDVNTGKELWKQNLGTIQKSSVAMGDGKIFVGTENGKFFILRPHQDHCEILDQDWLGSEKTPEQVLASVAISRGRVYLASMDNLYAIGKKKNPPLPAKPAVMETAPAGAAPAFLQVAPTEQVLAPGDKVDFRARLFDAHGRFIKETPAVWSLEQLKGTIENGKFTAGDGPSAGTIKATAEGLSGTAPARIIPPLPWSVNFESMRPNSVPRHWINATGKFQVREVEGNKVLVKLADNPFTKRARVYMGLGNWSNYTVEADVLATEKRRQMGDAGVVAQRYQLTLYGNSQKLELQPWQPEVARTVSKDFAWKSNAWYRLKLRVENTADGKTRARGKAWPAAEPEPAEWMIDRVDPIPNRQGSPGIYADAPFEVYLDNLKVTANQ